MRFISFILAAYFLWLSVKTCSDSSVAIDTCKTVACSHIETGTQDSHESDGCSPLCMCQCCGGVTLIYEHSPSFVVELVSPTTSIYLDNSTSELSYSIWQPPKV